MMFGQAPVLAGAGSIANLPIDARSASINTA
jgi:hypothetical protein